MNSYASRMEKLNRLGTPKQRRRKYREIIKELGARNIKLSDIIDPDSPKQIGFLDMLDTIPNATLDDAVILQQYGNAILNSDTRSAEFLRDSAGEKPSQQLVVEDTTSDISKMTLEELEDLHDLLKECVDKGYTDEH